HPSAPTMHYLIKKAFRSRRFHERKAIRSAPFTLIVQGSEPCFRLGTFARSSHHLKARRLPGFVGPVPLPTQDKSIRFIAYLTKVPLFCQTGRIHFTCFKERNRLLCSICYTNYEMCYHPALLKLVEYI